MIFTLDYAVSAGWLGKRMEQKRKEREAVAAIVKLGGAVHYDYQRGRGVATILAASWRTIRISLAAEAARRKLFQRD